MLVKLFEGRTAQAENIDEAMQNGLVLRNRNGQEALAPELLEGLHLTENLAHLAEFLAGPVGLRGYKGKCGDTFRSDRQRLACLLENSRKADGEPLDINERRLIIWQWLMQSSERICRQASHFTAMTWIPTHKFLVFSPSPVLERLAESHAMSAEKLLEQKKLPDEEAFLLAHTGVAWGELNDVRCLVMDRRKERGRFHWNCRVYRPHLDPQTHQLVLGEEEQAQGLEFSAGQSPLVLSFNFGTRPRSGSDGLGVAPGSVGTFQCGIDLCTALEGAGRTGDGVRSYFTWPRIWLGFSPADSFNLEEEPTVEFERFARDSFELAALSGSGVLAEALAKTGWSRRSGSDDKLLAQLDYFLAALSEEEMSFLLSVIWDTAAVEHDGLVFYPLDFFQPGNSHRLVQTTRRRCLSFDRPMMGREGLLANTVSEVSGCTALPNWHRDMLQAAVQVVNRHQHRSVGETRRCRYDLEFGTEGHWGAA